MSSGSRYLPLLKTLASTINSLVHEIEHKEPSAAGGKRVADSDGDSGTPSPKKKTRKSPKVKVERDPNLPKRPMTSFFRFQSLNRKRIADSLPVESGKSAAALLKDEWAALTEAEKQLYKDDYAEEMVEYNKKKIEYVSNKSPPPTSVTPETTVDNDVAMKRTDNDESSDSSQDELPVDIAAPIIKAAEPVKVVKAAKKAKVAVVAAEHAKPETKVVKAKKVKAAAAAAVEPANIVAAADAVVATAEPVKSAAAADATTAVPHTKKKKKKQSVPPATSEPALKESNGVANEVVAPKKKKKKAKVVTEAPKVDV